MPPKPNENKYAVAIPDENGAFSLVEGGRNLSWNAALDLAKDMSQSPACYGTPYTIFHEKDNGYDMAYAVYLAGVLWRRDNNPTTDYSLIIPERDDEDMLDALEAMDDEFELATLEEVAEIEADYQQWLGTYTEWLGELYEMLVEAGQNISVDELMDDEETNRFFREGKEPKHYFDIIMNPNIKVSARIEGDEITFDYSEEEPDRDDGGYDDAGAESFSQYDQ